MGFDQRALQLVFNVVMITGVTSLAIICHLLRRDKNTLAVKLNQLQQELEIATTAPAKSSTLGHQDIRQFVARRSQEWNARTAVKVG